MARTIRITPTEARLIAALVKATNQDKITAGRDKGDLTRPALAAIHIETDADTGETVFAATNTFLLARRHLSNSLVSESRTSGTWTATVDGSMLAGALNAARKDWPMSKRNDPVISLSLVYTSDVYTTSKAAQILVVESKNNIGFDDVHIDHEPHNTVNWKALIPDAPTQDYDAKLPTFALGRIQNAISASGYTKAELGSGDRNDAGITFDMFAKNGNSKPFAPFDLRVTDMQYGDYRVLVMPVRKLS